MKYYLIKHFNKKVLDKNINQICKKKLIKNE